MFIDKIDSTEIYSKFNDYERVVVFAIGKNFLKFQELFADTLVNCKQIIVADNSNEKIGANISLWNKSYEIHSLSGVKNLALKEARKTCVIITCNAYAEIVSQFEADDLLRSFDIYFFKNLIDLLDLPAKRKCNLFNKWLCLKNAGKSICDSKMIQSSEKIAFYGLGDMGKRFVEDLYSRNKNVAFCVVEKKEMYFTDFDIYTMAEELPACDAFVITDIEKCDLLRESLRLPKGTKIYSIEQIIEALWGGYWNLI